MIRITIWALAFIIVLKPVFGIEPNTALTALGIGGLAISFAMKDTLANLIAGLQITLGQTLVPGDFIRYQGYVGQIEDISWRETRIKTRIGEILEIPNSSVNGAALIKLTEKLEALCTIPFTLADLTDFHSFEKRTKTVLKQAVGSFLTQPAEQSIDIKFMRFSPYGVEGEIWLTIAHPTPMAGVRDSAVRALLELPEFQQTPLETIETTLAHTHSSQNENNSD